MKNLIKQLVKESLTLEAAKQGTPEELVELLELLPTDETALYLTEEIYQDILKYYDEDFKLVPKEYTYYPKDKCLKPYTVEIDFRESRNYPGIGFSKEQYIQIKYLDKDAMDFAPPYGGAERLKRPIYNIIKHECGHFYLAQKGVEECLYNTHPDGMEKYYYDRQEIVLHSREIFETLVYEYPNWYTWGTNNIISYLKEKIKKLRSHTNMNYPHPPDLQKQYLNFILNSYVKPKLKSIEEENVGFKTYNAIVKKLKKLGVKVERLKAKSLDDLKNDYEQVGKVVTVKSLEDEEEIYFYFKFNGLSYRIIFDKEEQTYYLNIFRDFEQNEDEIVSKFDLSLDQVIKAIN